MDAEKREGEKGCSNEISGPFQPTWESLANYEVPQWYQDAKFGIFIHWGVYSVPAFGSEWYPRNMYIKNSKEYKHHIDTYGQHTEFGYKEFIPQLTAANFDPKSWAELFHESGARYVVPVAEHHDGFAMYNTSYSEWSAPKMGPKRDVIGDLANAIREKGMVCGVSFHRAEHWWFYHGGKSFPSDVQDPMYEDFYGPAELDSKQPDEKFLEDWLSRCCELVDKYRPQVFYFDWWIEQPAFKPYLKEFAAYYYNSAAEWGQGVTLNYKLEAFPEGCAVLDMERAHLDNIRTLFWQTDTSVSRNSWGYIKGQDYKKSKDLICDLLDVVSKNGTLLLNIGPMPDGTIPQEEQDLLRQMGEWLKINGSAIYGTRPWKMYGEGPSSAGGGSDKPHAPFTSGDIRFTVGDEALFATALSWPKDGKLTIAALGSNLSVSIADVTVLGHDVKVEWKRDDSGLHVTSVPHPPIDPTEAMTCTLKIVATRHSDWT
ncbi:hypothetical protein R1flu_027254 [Riccia fluitans]|uniref:alpha-L-fucosidase n=1 Tax=Riccia fluitans TaxID=41844 RepID=A0ABD1XLA5_9MARC